MTNIRYAIILIVSVLTQLSCCWQLSFHTDCVDSDINTTWWLSLQLLKYQEVITLLNKANFFGITGRQNIVATNNLVMIFVALKWYHWSLPKQYRQHQISHFSIEIYLLFKCWQLGVSSKVVISSPNGRFRRCLDGMVGVREATQETAIYNFNCSISGLHLHCL